jgi:hypothetical protein
MRYQARQRRDDEDYPFAVDDTKHHRMVKMCRTREDAQSEADKLNAKVR